MTDSPARRLPCSKGILVLVFCAWAGSAYSQAAASFEGDRVIVDAQDAQGKVLHSAIGFVWDETTVVTSYQAVNGAAKLVVRTPSFQSEAKQMVSSNNSLDLALVKTSTELPLDPSIALMDTLATGDMVYFYSPLQADWRVTQSRVSGWIDSGQGYEYLTLEPKPEPTTSPLFNSKGKIAGWISAGGAVSIRAVYQSLANKETSLPLSNLAADSTFWNLYRPTPSALQDEPAKVASMKRVQGPAQFPFQMLVPGNWAVQDAAQPNRYLMMGSHAKSGIAMAVRVVPEPAEDLMEAFSEVETRVFSGAARAELMPYAADHITGLRGTYEDQVLPGYSTSIFCTLVNGKMYVVTITYLQKHAEQLRSLIDEIFASFRV